MQWRLPLLAQQVRAGELVLIVQANQLWHARERHGERQCSHRLPHAPACRLLCELMQIMPLPVASWQESHSLCGAESRDAWRQKLFSYIWACAKAA